ncbi:MAG TPA: hypothetical protein VL528_10710 [Oxalicibacterium sp.]|nr:hypothetical protein [Oxalicibacterium sp.]
MKKSLVFVASAFAAIAALSAANPALAGTHWSVNVGVGGFYPPAVYAPPPAPYYAPAPVYVQPYPVAQPYPQPVYVRPYVYGGGYYPAPRYIAPPPVYYRRSHRHYHDYRR